MLSKNNLSTQKSLYLKQHQDNPINWQSFSPEVLNQAKSTGKPVLMSIGYSSCHWCHVMAKESFSNEQIANYLNEHFVCIKVDKEEYPDLDHYYQQSAQLFVGNGGWPLNVFMFPDMKPFFAGTYYPPEGREKQTGFLDLVTELNRVFKDEKEIAKENSDKVCEQIEKGLMPEGEVEYEGHFPHPMSILNAASDFMDHENGGFGNAPKFPQFSFFEWMIEQSLEGMLEEKEMKYLKLTVNNMLMGGIFDQARGGIHRYSTDTKWRTPHFEKMLYDQSGLLKLLSKFCLIEPTALVFDSLYNTLDYLEKEMLTEEEKFFFASQDAESENVEGLYFTFSDIEFEDTLNNVDTKYPELKIDSNREKLIEWFQITKSGQINGMNVISLNPSFVEEYQTESNWELIRKIREELLIQRRERIPPATDSKGVSSWNFLLLNSIIDVMQFCPIIQIKQKATNLFNFLVEGAFLNFVSADPEKSTGSIIKHTNTTSNDILYFEDYVFFSESQLRLHEITGNDIFLKNFKDSTDFIKETFISKDHTVFQTNSGSSNIDYPKVKAECFDYSYKSPLSTYLQLLRRYQVLFKSNQFSDLYNSLKEKSIHDILKNPMNSGEALRALTYPDNSFRTLEIPTNWIENEEFLNIMPYFLHRFTITYHKEDNQKFQICSMESCEIEGNGIEEFKSKLIPNEK